MWAAAERPSEEGFRRNMLRDVASEVHSWAPGLDKPTVHRAAGEVLQGGRVWLRAQGSGFVAAEGWGTAPPTAGRSWVPRALTRT